MRVLVTGGAGFIGSHLVDRLLAEGAAVRVLDNLATGHRHNLAHVIDDIDYHEADLRNFPMLAQVVDDIDLIYHQAALASVPRSVNDPQTTFDVNVTGTLNLLVAARDAGVRRVVFASSSSVYGDSPISPKHEALTPNPLSPYAISKLSGEQLCTVFNNLYDIETVSLRYFNVFGPRQDPDSPYAAVTPKFIRALMSGERPVIYGDGEQSRGFTYISDVVEGNMLAGHVPEAAGKVLNLASDTSVTVNHALALIARELGVEPDPDFQPPRRGDIRDSLADIARAREILGFELRTPYEQGVQQTVTAYIQPSTQPA